MDFRALLSIRVDVFGRFWTILIIFWGFIKFYLEFGISGKLWKPQRKQKIIMKLQKMENEKVKI